MDKRVKRTQELLQAALLELIDEKGYDAVTIQDIVERAEVGRTTFYLHYRSKDDLFFSSHQKEIQHFGLGRFSKAELLADEPSPGLVVMFQYAQTNRRMRALITLSKDGALIMRSARDFLAQHLEDNFREVFDEADSSVPFHLLANYLAGSMMGLMLWWVEQRAPYSAEDIARLYQRMQRAAIREAVDREGQQ